MKKYNFLAVLVISIFIFSCSKRDTTTFPNNTRQGEQQNLSKDQLVDPNKIRLTLDKVAVTEGQGASEGDFELRIQAIEGTHNIVWPNASDWIKVDNGGAATSIDRTIAVYTLSGSLTKIVNLYVTEVDGGFNGGDDKGSGSISITMSPGMTPVVKYAYISLKRPDGKYKGQVKVYIKAQVA